jgi:hypothetical protein
MLFLPGVLNSHVRLRYPWYNRGLKITQDALCEGLGLNDNRVVSIHLLKYIDPLHPHLDVELEALDDWRFDESLCCSISDIPVHGGFEGSIS